VPFWFWNSKLSLDELERQIKLMSEAGLGGFFMHARFGLETEYMSDEWMSCVRHAVQMADKYGLKAWLYDEYPFPSGVGGLEVTRNPEYCNKYIDLVEITVTGPVDVSIQLPEGEILLSYAIPTSDMANFSEKAVESKILIQMNSRGARRRDNGR